VQTPSISLLIPCYNAASFLPRLLNSVQNLSQPFDTIICYDDGSQDRTFAVAKELGLEIISGGINRGVAAARNRLAEAAQTEWIHFHDADDLIAPNFLADLSPFCRENHDVVSCDADWVDDQTRELLIPWRYDAVELSSDPLPYLISHPMSLNNSILRRNRWLEIGGCTESLSMWEDADVHVRLAYSGARFHHHPQVLTHALRRPNSFSHDYRKSWTCRVDALEHYAALPGSKHISAVLASECERAASQLALLGAHAASNRALRICRRLGGDPPKTNHPLLKRMKPFFPDYWLLWLQARIRR